jgi:hypothetical protein
MYHIIRHIDLYDYLVYEYDSVFICAVFVLIIPKHLRNLVELQVN